MIIIFCGSCDGVEKFYGSAAVSTETESGSDSDDSSQPKKHFMDASWLASVFNTPLSTTAKNKANIIFVWTCDSRIAPW